MRLVFGFVVGLGFEWLRYCLFFLLGGVYRVDRDVCWLGVSGLIFEVVSCASGFRVAMCVWGGSVILCCSGFVSGEACRVFLWFGVFLGVFICFVLGCCICAGVRDRLCLSVAGLGFLRGASGMVRVSVVSCCRFG